MWLCWICRGFVFSLEIRLFMFVRGCGLDQPFRNSFGMMGMVWGLGVVLKKYFVHIGVGLWIEHLFRK